MQENMQIVAPNIVYFIMEKFQKYRYLCSFEKINFFDFIIFGRFGDFFKDDVIDIFVSNCVIGKFRACVAMILMHASKSGVFVP